MILPNEDAAAPSRPATRIRHGTNAPTPQEALRVPASDPDMAARAVLKPATPHELVQALATDPDERVRTLLARKIAAELPGLSDAEQKRLRDQATAVLTVLVEDEAVRVRAALADALKTMPEAPYALILRLAYDTVVSVSEPIIRLSPLLDAGDLLALLASPPHEAVATAVARRAGLPEEVSEAVAATADATAVRALLSNPSAQIRENTLNALISRAAHHEEWHEPLVRRPELSGKAARALSTFVADHLIELLAERADLGPQLAEELKRRVEGRLAASRAPWPPKAPPMTDEGQLLAAVQRGDVRSATSLLAMAADVPISFVERASALRSAKAIVSLVWKAGLSMRVAGPLQVVLAQLAPAAVLVPRVDGGFPLSTEEMRWHCDFLARPRR